MKKPWPTIKRQCEAGTLLAGILLAGSAVAQPEQWLEYHTASEARSYHVLKLTTNAPAGVPLPQLQARQPYFACWSNALDPKGFRWLCFDRNRKSGPYNLVYVDSNGNGRLDDEKPCLAAKVDDYYAYFDPLKLVFKGEDGPLTYHLGVRFLKYNEPAEVRAMISSGCYYEGKITVNGKKRIVTLLDHNVNGIFNDSSANAGDCDKIGFDADKPRERYLGKLVEVDKEFYDVEVARDGAFIKLKQAEAVVLGQVQVADNISELEVLGLMGQFIRKPVKGEVSLPVGQYRVLKWTMSRKDAKGDAWTLTGTRAGEQGMFSTAKNQPAQLDIGEPFKALLTATNQSKSTLAFGLRFEGRLGESIELEKGGQRPRAPKLILTSSKGGYAVSNSFEYG